MAEKDINEIFRLKILTNQIMHIPINLGRYKVNYLIKETPTSVVIGSADGNSRKIAIKCIPIQYLQSNEVIIMKNINDEHIIQVIDSFYYPSQNPRFFAIVMPIAFSDLYKYLKINYGYLTEEIVCQIMKKALEGLQVLHSCNIWHRNLALDNLLVTNYDPQEIFITISDFKYADLIDTPTVTAEAVGDLQYAAPELLEISNNKLQLKKKATCMLKKKNQKKIQLFTNNYMCFFKFLN